MTWPLDPHRPIDGVDPLAEVRARNERAGLDLDGLDPDPVRQLGTWWREATEAGVYQPEAMALATAGSDGQPSVRFVLLRGLDERGPVFYTNRESRKARELDENPVASLVMAWHSMGRQARVSGPVEAVTDDESDAYFATRPRGSQISAWASPQSQVVADRATLDARHHELEQRFAGEAVPRPSQWGGYRVRPIEIELWQQGGDRFHDRFRYQRTEPEGPWTVDRLGP